MKILSHAQIIDLEHLVQSKGNLTSNDLIALAADSFVSYFVERKKNIYNKLVIYAGNGKNGADALEIAKRLVVRGYDIELVIIYVTSTNCAEFIKSFDDLPTSCPFTSFSIDQLSDHIIPDHIILIDGIFGTGLNRELQPEIAKFIQRLNNLSSFKIAVDIPSGVFADSGVFDVALSCDETVALGTLKKAYFLDQKMSYIGKLVFAPIDIFGLFYIQFGSDFEYINDEMVRVLLKPYQRIRHKYNAGSCLIIGGRLGMSGCMLLAGKAAMRVGCGLITLHVPRCAVDFLQGAFPEAIIDADSAMEEVTECKVSTKVEAIAVGPAMGHGDVQKSFLNDLMNLAVTLPFILDADALGLLSQIEDWEKIIPENSIITPHQGEFEKLFGAFNHQIDRINFMQNFSQVNKIVIVLKGPDTVISSPTGKVYFNNTSNSGMATAGSGDVLTGIIVSLLSQGYDSVNAAVIGVFLHGTAGNLAREKFGFRSLIASDIIDHIGAAYISIDKGI